jgi:pyridinium-3,5-biscarboxylic acid mononucleotide sulfurtransferase
MDKRLKISSSNLAVREHRLRSIIKEMAQTKGRGRVIVGFSGGVDSSLLLWEAVATLGEKNVTAVTAVSPTSCPGEENAAREFAALLKVEHVVIPTMEMADPLFVSNTNERCYVCKYVRYEAISELARDLGGAVIFDGSQADDDPNDRPGMRALNELGIQVPLRDAHLGKADIRKILRSGGYSRLAEKNAQPCLATRIPTGEPITVEALAMISHGESVLKECGLHIFRLRHHFPIARIVTNGEGMLVILGNVELRDRIRKSLKELGYSHVTVDLEEYPR